jgi:hypothetical protein
MAKKAVAAGSSCGSCAGWFSWLTLVLGALLVLDGVLGWGWNVPFWPLVLLLVGLWGLWGRS